MSVVRLLEKVKEEQADTQGILKLGFFGRYAREGPSRDSDVDVCVLLETPSYMTRAAIKEEL